MVEILKNISEINAVSGNEHKLREYLKKNISADRIEVDSMGNLIAFKKGKSSDKIVALITHMDESGFIVSDFTDKGYVKFMEVGNIDELSIISKKVVINDKVPGVIGMKAIHLQKPDERKKAVKIKDLFIDIGAKDKKEAAEIVDKGDYIAFDTKFEKVGGNIKGKALDRIGVYVLTEVMKIQPKYDTYYVFTTQKEVGSRGAAVISERINADIAICIDTIQSGDMFGSQTPYAKLGNGAVVSLMNKKMIADKKISDLLRELARNNSIKIQNKCGTNDFSDWEVQYNPKCKCAMVDIPLRYAHTPSELVSLADIEAAIDLLKVFDKCEL